MTESAPEPRDQRGSGADEESIADELEVFEALPDEKKSEIARRALRMERRYHRGPLPDPQTLQGYEDVVSGSAERIINQANSQTDHRMRLEQTALDASVETGKRGQLFGFIIALAVVGVGAIAVFTGAGLISLGLILPGLAALVGVFVYSQRQQQGQLQENKEAFQQEEGELPPGQPGIEQGTEEDADKQE